MPRAEPTPLPEACGPSWPSWPAKRQLSERKSRYRWTSADPCGGAPGGEGGIRTKAL